MSELKAGLNEAQDTTFGNTGHQTIVHRKDHEGSLLIDTFTGQVLGHDQHGDTGKPDWAEGLTVAMLTERHVFYRSRLGSLYDTELAQPEVLAFEDLEWVGARPLVDADGAPTARWNDETQQFDEAELFVIEPDHEFRSEIVATKLGIIGDIDLEEGTIANAITVEIANDVYRSQEELEALEAEQTAGYKAVNE